MVVQASVAADLVIPNGKTGTVTTTSLHCFCAMVGAGVLALPHALGYLGWIAGPICIIAFYLVALLACRMLVSIYNVDGIEYGRYHHAVSALLNRRDAIIVSIFQLLTLVLVDVAYTITSGATASQLAQTSCQLAGTTSCFDHKWVMTLLFGAVEMVLSQVRNLEEAWWVSALGVVCSIVYSIVALGLSAAKAGNRAGTIAGIPGSPATKAFNVLNSLGAIAFSFSVSQILLEITDTLRQPPSGIVQGKRMVSISLTAAFSFYLVVAVTGYAALGNDVQGLILASFDTPSWAIILANAAVVLHMVFAFQVLAQPVFDTIESHIKYALLKRADAKFQKQQRRAAVGNGDAAPAHNPLDAPSPFDAEDGTKLGRTSTGNRSAMSMLGLAKTSLPPIEERMSASFSQTMQATMSQRMSGFDKSHHGGAKDEHHHDHKHVGIDSPDFPLVTRASHPPPMRMFSVGTGLANEEVPLNSENVLAPLWIRLLVRTAYVALVTLIAIVVPFFAAVVGVVGSLTFWPLVIYFPLKLYRKVYYVSPRFSMLLHVIWWGMLLVSTAAFIGSIYSVITSWSGFKIS